MTDIENENMPSVTPLRYSRLTILLHWVMALLIIGMLIFGKMIHNLGEAARTGEAQLFGQPVPLFSEDFLNIVNLFNLHKSVGLTLLILALIRLAVRLRSPSPNWPKTTPNWQKKAAQISHWALYGFMILVPLSGYIYASSTAFPTYLFLTEITLPHIPGISDAFSLLLRDTHSWLAMAMGGLLILHVTAALHHQFIRKDNLFKRIWV